MKMYLAPYYRPYYRGRRANATREKIEQDVHVPMDVKALDDAFVIEMIVPGLKPDDLEIEIVEDVVDIQGEFTKPEEEEGKFLRRERPYGKFQRRVKLPTLLDMNAAEAQLEQGILSLRVPKAEEALPRTVKVKAK